MGILFAVVFITLVISAACSLFEAVLYSTRIATLEAAKGSRPLEAAAARMLELKRNISGPIAGILILNTVANTLGATIAGMYASEYLGAALVPAFSVAFTLAILFFSEIAPKTIGAVQWPFLWRPVAPAIRLVRFCLSPAIRVTEGFTRLLLGSRRPPSITEEEILAAVRLGAREGQISEEESRLVRNIIHLEEKTVRDIMTPRTVVFTLDAGATVGSARRRMQGKGFSRIPVHDADPDSVIGYVTAQDISRKSSARQSKTKLVSIMRPIAEVAEEDNCLRALATYLKARIHIAIVRDEFGGISGIVTLEDLIETLLGKEIVDETDQVVDLQELARAQQRPGSRPVRRKR